jgi:hypothetical protein
MRALDIVVFLALIAVVIGTVAAVFPGYNNGKGLPVGNQSFSFVASMQVAGLSQQFSYFGGDSPSILDYARMTVEVMWIAIVGFITICSIILFAYPMLVNVLNIPVQMGVVIQLVIYIVFVIGAAQVYRGGFTWKAYE